MAAVVLFSPNIVKFHVTAEPLPAASLCPVAAKGWWGRASTMAAKQPPPLMKKHSQTDLVSRLKTRKILGVGGEDDDGEVHRSKVRLQRGKRMCSHGGKRTFCWANQGLPIHVVWGSYSQAL